MKRAELFASIEALIEAERPDRGDLVYLERRGDEYDWRIVPPDGPINVRTPDRPEPDAWMSFSAAWPEEPERLRPFFDDLIAELDSVAMPGAVPADRCRWPIDQPWTRPSRLH